MAINNLKLKTKNKKGGFTIFFAMLVGGLALAIGVAIYDLTVRELDLSGAATQSQFAIYAADTGAECALYWDYKCALPNCRDGSTFASSTTFVYPTSGVVCGTRTSISGPAQDVATQAPPAADIARYPECSGVLVGSWCTEKAAATATTTFAVYFDPQPYCAIVTVAKFGSPTQTVITSRGYNTCTAGAAARLERVLRVNY